MECLIFACSPNGSTDKAGQRKATFYQFVRSIFTAAICFVLVFFYANRGFILTSLNSVWISLGVSLAAGLGSALSKSVRCSLVLGFTQLSSGVGRFLLFLCLAWLMVSHPLNSILLNLKEVAKTVDCVGGQKNSTFELVESAYQDVFEGIALKMEKNLAAVISIVESTNPIPSHVIEEIELMLLEMQKLETDSNGSREIQCEPNSNKKELISSILNKLQDLKQVPKLNKDSRLKVMGKSIGSFSDKELMNPTKLAFYKFVENSIVATEIMHYMFLIIVLLFAPISAFFYLKSTLSMQRHPEKESEGCWVSCGIGERKTKRKAKRGFMRKLARASNLLCVVFLVFAICMLFFAAEYVLHWALNSSQSNNGFSFHVGGSLAFVTDFKIGNVMSNILNSIFNAVSVDLVREVSPKVSDCLPRLVPPSQIQSYFFMLSLFCVLIVLVFLEDYLQKKQRLIVKYFYPEDFTDAQEILRLQRLELQRTRDEMAKNNEELRKETAKLDSEKAKLKDERRLHDLLVAENEKERKQKELENKKETELEMRRTGDEVVKNKEELRKETAKLDSEKEKLKEKRRLRDLLVVENEKERKQKELEDKKETELEKHKKEKDIQTEVEKERESDSEYQAGQGDEKEERGIGRHLTVQCASNMSLDGLVEKSTRSEDKQSHVLAVEDKAGHEIESEDDEFFGDYFGY